jgi:energy-coupling factor transport system substrate-specific component
MNAFQAGFIAFGAALNVSVGYLVNILKLPLYLDSIGTILVSALCGWRYGIVTGLAALVVMTVTSVPTVFAYAGTVIVISLTSAAFAKIGFLKSVKVTVLGGLVIGLASSMVSVPVTAFLFGGVSLAGSDVITTFFKASGLPIWQSVLYGSLVTDPLDKLATAVICLMLVRSLPVHLIDRLPGKNFLNTSDKKL